MSVISWSSSWETEKEYRENIDPNKICTFGIKVLDDILYGILPKDLIVFGGDSGSGKTEIGIKIAIHNALHNKRIGMYFLEGGDEEFIARVKWDLIRDKYYSEGHKGIDMDYRKWRMNMIKDPVLKIIESECLSNFREKIKQNLLLYRNPKGLTIQDFLSSLETYVNQETKKHNLDLIIIDHLQYFTLTNPKEELIEQSLILKTVNEIAHNYKIPIILISHLRKKEKARGLPSQEDFYGTSNTPKMSSISITITSEHSENGINFPTYFRFVKTRTKIPSNFALCSEFNMITGKYNDKYYVYSIIADKLSENPLTIDKIPRFAKGATPYVPIIKKDRFTD